MSKQEVYVNGKKVAVSEEVYRLIKRDEWREQQRKYRAWRCRDAKGVVCRKDCSQCSYYLNGGAPTGNVLSLERLMDSENGGYEPMDVSGSLEEEVARRILREAVLKARLELGERDRQVLDCVMQEMSDSQIAERLGITKSGAREARYRLFSRLKQLLSDFSDYFQN